MKDTLPSHLEQAVLSYLKALDDGHSQVVADCLKRHESQVHALKSFDEIERWAHQAASRVATDRPTEDVNSTEKDICDQIQQQGRYVCHQQLGQGGIGMVMLGRDTLLDRSIAIKFLQKRHRAKAGVIARFFDEVRITANLQHPGIPPVYDLGVTEGGYPYMVMRVIEGRTLSDLLAERKSLTENLPRFLSIFQEIAQTVSYAHCRGVLHRDLKPRNIMSGAFGEVQVMDWGLAKRCATRDESPFQGYQDETPLPMDRTLVGTVIGTPGYMSPEQASGNEASYQSDVFGLGAILCEILTGEPPNARNLLSQETDIHERLRASGADPALVQLAQRCLALSPTDRPADGQAVAKAITEYLNAAQDKLRLSEISQIKTLESHRRHRTTYFFLTFVLLLILSALGLFVYQQSHANQKLSDVNKELLDANALADKRFHLATDAIARFHGSIAQDIFLKGNEFEHLRNKLLLEAVEFYKKLESQDTNLSQTDLAKNLEEIGWLYRNLGNPKEAMRTHENSIRILTPLAASPQSSPSIRVILASAHTSYGFLSEEQGNKDALDHATKAISILENLHVKHEPTVLSLRALGQAYVLSGKCRREDESRFAIAEYDRSCRLFEEASRLVPNDRSVLHELGVAYLQRGVMEPSAFQRHGFFSQSLKCFRLRLKSDPTDPEARHDVAHCLAALAGTDGIEIPLETLFEYAQESVKISTELVRVYPSMQEFRRVLAMALQYGGSRAMSLGQLPQALELLESSKTHCQILTQGDAPWHAMSIPKVEIALGDVFLKMGKNEEASAAYKRAVDKLNVLYPKQEGRLSGKYHLGRALRRLAYVEVVSGKVAEGSQHVKQATELLAPLLGKLDHFAYFYFDVAACYALQALLADVQDSGISADERLQAVLKAMELLQTNLNNYRPHPQVIAQERAFDTLTSLSEFRVLIERLTRESGKAVIESIR